MSFALFHCICFFCSLQMVFGALNSKNITLGSTLTAGDESTSPWASPSGDFAFGFQQVAATGGFLLAIWFNKIPDKTVTWSANRDQLALKGSKLQLTANGLVLNDPNGNEMLPVASGSGVTYATILETGNLMLSDGNGETLWQSFDSPTDTILPTQIMNQGTALVARLSDTNYSSGRFQFIMRNDGNLVSYTLNWPQHSIQYYAYWSSNTLGSEYQVVFNQSGMISVVAKNGTVFASIITNHIDSTQYYQRAILEYDGVFRRYVYPKSSATKQPMNWTMSTDFVPQDICKAMNGIKGGGACGFNSYCQIGGDKKTKCGCPPGYSFFDEIDQLKGCKRDFVAQSCLEDSHENGRFELVEMAPANLWGSDSETFTGLSETACRDSCLSDCLCAAVVSNSRYCWKKRFPLSNGWIGPNAGGKAFIKVGKVNSTMNTESGQEPQSNPTIQGRGDKHRDVVLVGLVFLGSSVFLNILFLTLAVLTITFYSLKRNGKSARVQQGIAGTSIINFSYKELQEATDGFKEEIGQGAYSTVYKGVLDAEEGKVIAVKKLKELAKESQGEFEREVKAIARTGHQNLVQLIGFCNEEQHRLLVYEYMCNGSIADILFQDEGRPNWSKRIKFAFETARGLHYLHEECNIQIIHCDIKPQNVLLDDSFTVRISDFGLAKLLKKDQTHTLTGIRGTRGYVAPEWFRSMPITTKVDVYSYGIMLLEIICCRRCFIAEMEDESQKVLADWAFDCCNEGRIDNLMEGDYEALHQIEKVKKYIMIALCCIQEDPSHRPSMNEVLQMIKGEIEDSVPRNLASYFASLDDGSGDGMYSPSVALIRSTIS